MTFGAWLKQRAANPPQPGFVDTGDMVGRLAWDISKNWSEETIQRLHEEYTEVFLKAFEEFVRGK